MLGSATCLSPSLVMPYDSPVTWSMTSYDACFTPMLLSDGIVANANKDRDHFASLPSHLVSLDLQLSSNLVQVPMPSVFRAPAMIKAQEPKTSVLIEGFQIDHLKTFIDLLVSSYSGDKEGVAEKLAYALEKVFTFQFEEEDVVDEDEEDFEDGFCESCQQGFQDDLLQEIKMLYELICNEHVEDNMRESITLPAVNTIVIRATRIQRLIECLEVPKIIVSNEITNLVSNLKQVIKPEGLLSLNRKKFASFRAAVETNSLLAAFPVQSKKIATLIELSMYETTEQYSGDEITMSLLFSLCSPKHQQALADLFLQIINQAGSDKADILVHFCAGEQELNTFESMLYALLNVIELSSGGRVQIIHNDKFLEKFVLKIAVFLRELIAHDNDLEMSGEGFVFDNLRQLLIYNPTIRFVHALIQNFIPPKLHNHFIWILKNIPKKTMTRDARRSLGNYVLIMFQQEAFLGSKLDAEWDAKQISTFNSLFAEQAYLAGELAQAQDPEEMADLQEAYHDLAGNINNLASVGINDFRVLTEVGFNFETYAEYKDKARVVVQFYTSVARALNRSAGTVSEQQEMALAFVAFCNAISNFSFFINGKGAQGLFKKLSALRLQRGCKEFLNAQDVRDFTSQIKAMAMDSFFKVGNLSAKQKHSIRRKIRNPLHPLNNIKLLNQIVSYHGFQTQKGKQAVEEFMLSLTNAKRNKQGIKAVQRRFVVKKPEESVAPHYLEVFNSMLEHLQVGTVTSINHEGLERVMKNIELALRKAKELSVAQREDWKKQLVELKKTATGYNLDEVLIDLDKLVAAANKSTDEEMHEYDAYITGDLVDILKAGEEPQRTCQRISSAGVHNRNGEPVYRALHPNVSMVGLREADTGQIVARAVLEYVHPGIVLVERFYIGTNVSVTEAQFTKIILRLLAESKGIKNVVFALPIDELGMNASTVTLGELPDGYYRDTYRSYQKYPAVELKDYIALNKLLSDWSDSV